MEIPCPTCPTWSHFIQDKLKISICLSLDKFKCINTIFAFHILINNYELTSCSGNSVDLDQLASLEQFRSQLMIRILTFYKMMISGKKKRKMFKHRKDKYIMAIYLSLDK